MSVVRGGRSTSAPRNTRACSFEIQAVVDSRNDLATADTPELLNSKAGEILSTSPQ
jgi:hypothetical protein